MNLSQMPTVKMQIHDSRERSCPNHLSYPVLRQGGSVFYTITESLQLVKISNIIKSNHQLDTVKSTMSLSATSTDFLNTFRDSNSITSLGSLFQGLAINQINPHLHNLRPFPLLQSLVTWELRLSPTLLQPPFEF